MNSVADDHVQPGDKSPDFVMEYSILLLKYYLVADIKDAVREGNGKRINHLHKQLFHHFKTDSGYNAYSIEMFISIIQNEVLLSEEVFQCTWAAMQTGLEVRGRIWRLT